MASTGEATSSSWDPWDSCETKVTSRRRCENSFRCSFCAFCVFCVRPEYPRAVLYAKCFCCLIIITDYIRVHSCHPWANTLTQMIDSPTDLTNLTDSRIVNSRVSALRRVLPFRMAYASVARVICLSSGLNSVDIKNLSFVWKKVFLPFLAEVSVARCKLLNILQMTTDTQCR